MAKSYPEGYAVSVPEEEWLSQEQAARALGVSLPTVGLLIANDHLVPATTPTRRWGVVPTVDAFLQPGVTAASVSAEKRWRQSAPRRRRWFRRLKDIPGWF